MADFEEAVRIALTLPAVHHEGTGVGVRDKGLAWIYNQKVPGQKGRTLRPDVLAVWVSSLEEKAALIAAEPEKFFDDDHYRGFKAVLVRLAAVDSSELTELLTDAWRDRAPRRLVKQFDSGEISPMSSKEA